MTQSHRVKIKVELRIACLFQLPRQVAYVQNVQAFLLLLREKKNQRKNERSCVFAPIVAVYEMKPR